MRRNEALGNAKLFGVAHYLWKGRATGCQQELGNLNERIPQKQSESRFACGCPNKFQFFARFIDSFFALARQLPIGGYSFLNPQKCQAWGAIQATRL